MRLTHNQKETLHALATKTVTGLITKPIPSLIQRGLVVEVRSTEKMPLFGKPVPTVQFWLTPLGLETYKKLRTDWHETRIEQLSAEFKDDLATAAARVQSE